MTLFFKRKAKRQHLRWTGGFTLLEVLVAISLTGAMTVLLLQSYILINRSHAQYQHSLNALSLLNQLYFEQQYQPASSTNIKGCFLPPYANFRWEVKRGRRSSTGNQNVRLSVLWSDAGEIKRISALTVLKGRSDEKK